MNDDDVVALGAAWMILAFLLLVVPAAIVDTDRHDNLYLGTFLLVALIIWLAPLVLASVAVATTVFRVLFNEYGRDLLPHRWG